MNAPLQTPQEIHQQIWKELGRASRDRHHAWRTPVLATTGSDGVPNARTVVLREVDAERQRLYIYTDRRSPKVRELAKTPDALFVFWSTRLHWQLRVLVVLSIQTEGPRVEALWQHIQQTPAAADYLGRQAPGSPLAAPQSGFASPQPESQFALLDAQVREIDWLELGRDGHRRASFREDSWQWLAP
jgi:pyridoxamine 5'-phosphate oxidase